LKNRVDIRHFIGHETFHEGTPEPTTLGKRTTNTTSIPHFSSQNVSYEVTERDGNIEKGKITIKD